MKIREQELDAMKFAHTTLCALRDSGELRPSDRELVAKAAKKLYEALAGIPA